MPDDPLFLSNALRVENRAALSAMIIERTQGWQRDDLLDRLAEEEVPAGPINNVGQAFADPQIIHRHLQLSLARTGQEPIPGVGLPIHFSDAQLDMSRVAPPLARR